MKTLIHLVFFAAAVAAASFNSSAQETNAAATEQLSAAESTLTNSAATDVAQQEPHSRGAVVAFGQTARSREGQSPEAVVAIGGSAEANSNVREAVVAILGDANAKGDVGEAVVAIFGNAHAEGKVRDAVVAILGNVTLGSNAVVRDAIAIGGTVTLAEGAKVHGTIQEIPFSIPGLPNVQELPLWIRECVFKLRPLSFQVAWPWAVAGVFFLVYALTALAFPRPVAASLDEINRRPATTFFVGMLVKTILLPVLTLILFATGIGILVIPFLFAAVLFAAIVGKVAMLQYLGGALTRAVGVSGTANNLLALVIGSVIVLMLYVIPIVGFLAYAIFGLWALGAAVTATFTNISREKPRPPQSTIPPGPATPDHTQSAAATQPAGSAFSGTAPNDLTDLPPALVNPRAGFWERMGAGFLDLALLAVPAAVLGPFVIPVALAYFAGMWTWKGTTIGGLVLRHQVVRQNGEPLTFVVALVRSLAAVFSAFVFFLGFFWIGWNSEKQGWHDLIAGTCVVRVPQAIPLVCL